MQTVDGTEGSSVKIIDVLINQKIKELLKNRKNGKITNNEKHQILTQV